MISHIKDAYFLHATSDFRFPIWSSPCSFLIVGLSKNQCPKWASSKHSSKGFAQNDNMIDLIHVQWRKVHQIIIAQGWYQRSHPQSHRCNRWDKHMKQSSNVPIKSSHLPNWLSRHREYIWETVCMGNVSYVLTRGHGPAKLGVNRDFATIQSVGLLLKLEI
jgi:hypothetical protein